ncbi:DUF1697 domain-containing protein [Streptomyces sp. AK02-01A]|uniref:DUF1697 domain-containing protein n=1 Tax=Streptomyces sp. AK02-01A TaxID=3028648 RepID=UPI0029A12942|nr:DUF1697 domain-containing protein [Streptomyces sp. AK02-01A]MDX3850731.1 DUF1697 domain-containing protein [Streptomyces sp. AK02-01A]
MTTTYAALLRGINVSGHKRVPMGDLRELLTRQGHGDVRTYLQSGNAVFTSASDDERALTTALERAIEQRFGFRVECVVRGAGYLRAVAEACPFPATSLEAKQLHVTYFSEPVDPGRLSSLDQAVYMPEEFRLGDRALYLYAPNGLGRSKLAGALARPALFQGVTATTRNWNTVVKLVELTHG